MRVLMVVMGRPLIIVGHSVRAAAQSAVRAGYEPWCIDLCGSRDLHDIAATASICPADQYPAGILKMLEQAPPDAQVLLTGDMENHPDFLEAIAFERPLHGSSAQSIRLARQPRSLTDLPPFKGLKFATSRTHSSLLHRLGRMIFGVWGNTRYLLKPCKSFDGKGISWWSPGRRIGREHYIQQYVPGMPLSAVFWADGWSSSLLGATEQLVGMTPFGAGTFTYCGSIGPLQLSEKSRAALNHLGVILTQRNDLRGLFGVDLVMDHRGRLWPIEVNPRYPQSAAVLERGRGIVALSRGGSASSGSKSAGKTGRSQVGVNFGQAIIRIDRPVEPGDLYELFDRDQIADLPPLGAVIEAGNPICTVMAQASTRDQCLAHLEEMARKLGGHLVNKA
jgi:predicted ATP-grasp superfamily ATP-dependent carboligase